MYRPRVYCVVYGCLNSSSSKPELSFFKLPAALERRSKWLRLISREDLTNKPPQNYTVCEEHFDAVDILPGARRKKLKTNSLPCIRIPDIQKKDAQTFTEATTMVDKCLQAGEDLTVFVNESFQTSRCLSCETPRKRKLKIDLLQCRKNLNLREIDHKTGKCKRDTFYKLCDRFLTKELAELVKVQTRLSNSESYVKLNQTIR